MNIKAVLKSDFRVVLLIAITWQVLLTIAGIILTQDWTNGLSHTIRWDSGWYLDVVNNHYTTNPASPVFYPLFPTLVIVLSTITFHLLPYAVIGLIINTVSLWLGIAALLVTSRKFLTDKFRFLPVIFLFTAPAAFFMHLFYSEALFIAIGFWAYTLALKRQWLWMGVALGFLTATRFPSVLFVALCGLEYLRAYDWKIKKAFNPNLAYFLLAPIGFIIYGLYLLNIQGDFWAMFNGYGKTHDWPHQHFDLNIIHTIGHEIFGSISQFLGHRVFSGGLVVNHIIPLFSLALLFVCSLYMIFKYKSSGIPLGIFGLLSIIVFTLNSNIISVHRYTLPCIVIYIALAHIYIQQPKWRTVIIFLSIFMFALQSMLFWKLYQGTHFVG
jgi:hypothetical protein